MEKSYSLLVDISGPIHTYYMDIFQSMIFFSMFWLPVHIKTTKFLFLKTKLSETTIQTGAIL